jgi:nucleoside-diphosphate-sugar epimerase
MEKILVTGAGGFIGGHLVDKLLALGHPVRAVDCKPLDQWHQFFRASDNISLDLKEKTNCKKAVKGCAQVYHLAADMGGWEYIDAHKVQCMLNVLIDTHMLLAAYEEGVQRFFYSSTACVYDEAKQADADNPGLKESDAYPANPGDGYGWEKLFAERMCRHFAEDYRMITRVARYHNIYGPHGDWRGGREKAPAAFCRRIIEAKLSGRHEIEIHADGDQTRSFTYIDDCIKGTMAILASDITEPINLGSSEMVTINELVAIVEAVSGITVRKNFQKEISGGVRGRNSDNTLIQKRLGWEPATPLRIGMQKTYQWIYDQMVKS